MKYYREFFPELNCYNNIKKPKILSRIFIFVLAQTLVIGQSAWCGTEHITLDKEAYYLSPQLQINNQILQYGLMEMNTLGAEKERDVGHEEFSWQTRKKMVDRITKGDLKDELFDFLIIGGGITGTSAARDLTQRGFKTFVVEGSDWAEHASGNSGNIVHRGVLYLEKAWTYLRKAFSGCLRLFNREHSMRETAKEVKEDLKTAMNHLRFALKTLKESENIAGQSAQITKAKRVHLVLDKAEERSPLITYCGVMLHWALSGFSLGRPRLYIGKNSIEKNFPELDTQKIKAVVTFYEYVTDGKLLTVYTAKDAYRHGAITLNFARVAKAEYNEEKGYYSIRVRDLAGEPAESRSGHTYSSDEFTVKARFLVNSAGSGIDIVHSKILKDEAVIAEGRKYTSSRGKFLLPVFGSILYVPEKAVGSNRTYLMSMPVPELGMRKPVFITHRDEETGGYYQFDTRDFIDDDKALVNPDGSLTDEGRLLKGKLAKSHNITQSEHNMLDNFNEHFKTGDNIYRSGEEEKSAMAFINSMFTGASVSIYNRHSRNAVKPFPFIDTRNIGNIPREHRIINLKDRYFVLIGVKLAAGRAAAEDLGDMVCGILNLKDSKYNCKTQKASLHIPDDVYALSPGERVMQQMVVFDEGSLLARYGPGHLITRPEDEQLKLEFAALKRRVRLEQKMFGGKIHNEDLPIRRSNFDNIPRQPELNVLFAYRNRKELDLLTLSDLIKETMDMTCYAKYRFRSERTQNTNLIAQSI
ncbi:MAG: FAD-dependent oxidoreductase [Candidatus Omnitrophica bacterium]|nr:FAD-dependent oxidoreductase [Candidatus Omnitrophota bacterium]